MKTTSTLLAAALLSTCFSANAMACWGNVQVVKSAPGVQVGVLVLDDRKQTQQGAADGQQGAADGSGFYPISAVEPNNSSIQLSLVEKIAKQLLQSPSLYYWPGYDTDPYIQGCLQKFIASPGTLYYSNAMIGQYLVTPLKDQ